MEFKDIMKRAEFTAIGSYLRSGDNILFEPDHKSYEEQIISAEAQISSLLSEWFPDRKEHDLIYDRIFHLTGTYIDVFFELGVLSGAKIGYQLKSKLDELK